MTTYTMTNETARTFDRKSRSHEMVLAQVAAEKGCNCAAYVDWFTYRRWKAQEMQVQKGERGIKLTTWVPVKDDDGNVVRTFPRTVTVFCRCQVAKA